MCLGGALTDAINRKSDVKSQPSWPRTIVYVVGLAITCAKPAAALAKDLGVLERITYAAFVADQGSAICASARLNFSADDTTAFQSAKNYAQWIKQRVSEGLSDDDVRSVLVAAADRAKNETREATKTFRSEAELLQWCTAAVAPLVRQVVGTYTRNRVLIDEIIQKAKID